MERVSANMGIGELELLQDFDFAYDSGFASLTSQILIVNPSVGLLETRAERGVGLPVEIALDQRVVAIAAVHAFGSVQVVLARQLDAGDVFDDVYETIDGDRFAGAKVDGLQNVGAEDQIDSL